ncbi:MAG: winged helix-turn-helix transcriptional regulator [Verrucomicrobiales bacterium]|nr:winged helix-turn-helix transcriptional regulator [Verrucomicrobiales bacterium]
MREFLNITKALADESRIRVLFALRGGELCACQIVEFLALAGSTVSKHLSLLYQAGLVTLRKEGRWIYYSLPGNQAPPAVRSALKWVFQSAGELPRIAEDAREMKRILKLDPVVLCRRQCKR